MQDLLKKAFDKISSMSEKDKNAFAAFILEEIASEERWEELYKESEDKLKHMASEALKEYDRGITEELDFDKF